MTRNLQPALHRAHVALSYCTHQAVVIDRDGVAWQRWYSRWWASGHAEHYDDSLCDYMLAERAPIKVVHKGVKR